jgi:Predicted membrane protein
VEEDSAGSEVAAAVSAAAARDRAGDQMRTREFLSKLEHDRIIQAIEAESKTSGEIRVLIERGKLKSDPPRGCTEKFHRLGMHKTRERNAVLIFVAPRVHKFAVVGDNAIHEKCGDEFWQRVVERMRMHFQNEKFSDALVEAVEEIGAYWPGTFLRR